MTMIQMDLIQMDDYPVDNCTTSPTAFLFLLCYHNDTYINYCDMSYFRDIDRVNCDTKYVNHKNTYMSCPRGLRRNPMATLNIRCLQRGGEVALIQTNMNLLNRRGSGGAWAIST